MEMRRKMLGKYSENKEKLRRLNKDITRVIRKDVRNYNTKWITTVIEENKSMKVLRNKLSLGKKEITKLETTADGKVITNRIDILKTIENFYANLYSNKEHRKITENVPQIMNQGSEEMPPITREEMQKSLSEMKNNKSPGEDDVVIEAVKGSEEELLRAITNLFNKCLEEAKTPSMWNNAIITIMHKKGNIVDLQNYRPISLLTHLYKLFTKVVVRRLTPKLDSYQPKEQAGFRSGYGTNDHLQVIKTLIERCVEYNKPLVLTFVDYEKAFDSI